MNIIISNTSGKPIYEQIATQIKNEIIAGKLKEGDNLPSMRVLAKELRISVITTKRAYEELEREGFIVSMTGKGSFVAGKNLEFVREEELKKMEEHIQKAVEAAKNSEISLEELIETMTIVYNGEKQKEGIFYGTYIRSKECLQTIQRLCTGSSYVSVASRLHYGIYR